MEIYDIFEFTCIFVEGIPLSSITPLCTALLLCLLNFGYYFNLFDNLTILSKHVWFTTCLNVKVKGTHISSLR